MIEFLESARSSSLGLLAWLATYAVHSTLLLGAAWLIARRLRSPRLRELVWRGALVGALLTTITQATLGGGPLTLRTASSQTVFGLLSVEHGLTSTNAGLTLDVPIGEGAVHGASPDGPRTPSTPGMTPRAVGTTGTSVPAMLRLAWPVAVVVAWGAWALVGLIGLLLQRRRLGQALAHRRRVTASPLVEMLARMRRRRGPRRSVHLCTSPHIPSPIALGTSEICVPSFATDELNTASQKALLAHELAHLRRLDALWSTLASVLARLFPFQPFHRVAGRRLREEAELLCDADALRETGDPTALARCLVEVAERTVDVREPVWTAAMAARQSSLVQRVELALEGGARAPRKRLVVLTALASIGALVAVACTGPGWSTKQAAVPLEVAEEPEPAEPIEMAEPLLLEEPLEFTEAEPLELSEFGLTTTKAEPLELSEFGLTTTEAEPLEVSEFGLTTTEAEPLELSEFGLTTTEAEPLEVSEFGLTTISRDGVVYSVSPPAEPLEIEEPTEATPLAGLGYISSEPVEPVKRQPAVRLVLNAAGAITAGERVILAADDNDFEPVRLYLSGAAASMTRIPMMDNMPDGPTIADDPLLIRAEAATPFNRVLGVLEQCGSREVLIWRIELDLVGTDGERATYPVPLPRDVGVYAEDEESLAPLRFEVEVERDTMTLRIPTTVNEPKLDWSGTQPSFELELQTRLTVLARQYPRALFTIDTSPDTRSERAATVLRLLRVASPKTVTFIGRDL